MTNDPFAALPIPGSPEYDPRDAWYVTAYGAQICAPCEEWCDPDDRPTRLTHISCDAIGLSQPCISCGRVLVTRVRDLVTRHEAESVPGAALGPAPYRG